jgi:hypothetical protein
MKKMHDSKESAINPLTRERCRLKKKESCPHYKSIQLYILTMWCTEMFLEACVACKTTRHEWSTEFLMDAGCRIGRSELQRQ